MPVKNGYPIDGGSEMFLTTLSLKFGALLKKQILGSEEEEISNVYQLAKCANVV